MSPQFICVGIMKSFIFGALGEGVAHVDLFTV